MLRTGVPLEIGIRELEAYIRGTTLIGYNIAFDLKFINRAFAELSLDEIRNPTIDLMHEAKKKNSFQVNYKLETTLNEYHINQRVIHRALEDARLIRQLYDQMKL